ncbi:DNA cytosine methyltransferase [Mesorhizobium sp. B2-4-2]|nr:DNA cytosine methyltransferase [Mesorhizobium sp. BR1-1-7]MBZ9970644.1 DNA cytosine methyltransferase [Mesorhizobium sp. BR1-1-12]TPL53671.1 DNA cytosine methyltransferase [Mesorhizobium sp. B2-4-2]
MPNAVDIFSGSGGVTQGLRAAGWRVLAACDNDAVAAATYRANHRRTKFVEADILLDKTIDRITAAAGDRHVHMLVICAPCQPFSSQNRYRGDDAREQLIVRAISIAQRLDPDTIFFENVPGLATPAYRSIVSDVQKSLAEFGYVVTEPMVRDAADFGVPQRRKRCIMFAAKSQAALKAFRECDVTAPRKSVFQAIADLPALMSSESSKTDVLHRARTHLPIALERLIHIPMDGGSRKSLPEHLELVCHKNKAKSFSDVYGRMSWHDVAPTLTTGCTDVTRGRFAHPEQHRAITLREAARLQSFPDSYKFIGGSGQVAAQIGNAVPPDMIKAFVPAFKAALAATPE